MKFTSFQRLGTQKSGAPSGDVQCYDFETQQQARSVFEQDEIVYGDALETNINGFPIEDQGACYSAP